MKRSLFILPVSATNVFCSLIPALLISGIVNMCIVWQAILVGIWQSCSEKIRVTLSLPNVYIFKIFVIHSQLSKHWWHHMSTISYILSALDDRSKQRLNNLLGNVQGYLYKLYEVPERSFATSFYLNEFSAFALIVWSRRPKCACQSVAVSETRPFLILVDCDGSIHDGSHNVVWTVWNIAAISKTSHFPSMPHNTQHSLLHPKRHLPPPIFLYQFCFLWQNLFLWLGCEKEAPFV